ncbi:MAG: ATP-grasp domain-containing protein [Candidatus Diapherotrites archaeon]|nr:ATP-grasp domain-containing protein [Candidatus Diapherotrites archaeon]
MKVLVTGCGGNIGIDIIRSLRDRHDVVVCDISKYQLEFGKALVDTAYLLPPVSRPEEFTSEFNRICEKERVDLVLSNPDPEVEYIATHRKDFDAEFFLMGEEYARHCINKHLTYELLKGLADFPATREVGDEDGIREFFEKHEGPFWMRAAEGAGGRGSIMVKDLNHALHWFDYWKDKNWKWVIHEYLPGRNFNWTALVKGGEVITSASMERLEYLMRQVSVSGVTGNVSRCITVHDERLNKLGLEVCKKFRTRGIVSIDIKEDSGGVPNITEVGIRLAGRPWLYTRAGANLAQAITEIVDGKEVSLPQLNPTRPGMTEIRQVDIEPVIIGGE